VKRLLVFPLLLLLPGLAWPAITLTCTGDWSDIVDQNDLSGATGSDLNSTYQSSSSAGLTTIAGCQNRNDIWRVDIRRSDTTWSTSLHLYARRTGDGTGNGRSISGGTTYAEIGTTNVELFRGQGDHANIPLQFQATGVSYALAVSLYQTTIILTVVNI